MSISMAMASLLSSAGATALMHTSDPLALADRNGAASASADAVKDEAAPPTNDAAASQDATIVVTGSRVVTDGTRSPTPVVVVSTDQLAANAPQGISEGLNQLPIFQASQSPAMTNLASNTRVRSGNFMNLRGLGPQRVLVLMDGNRLPQSGNYGAVDSNIVPQMLIQRVDVVTGGASAVYGSEAVSGVVNYVIDKRFKGLKTLAQYGVSAYDDVHSYRVGAAVGTSLVDDRLKLQFSGEYYWNQGIPTRSRGTEDEWAIGALDPTLASGAQGSINNPILDYTGVRSTITSLGGLIYGGPVGLINMQFNSKGQLVPFDLGKPIGTPGVGAGSDGPPECPKCASVVARVSTLQFFGRATYDFGGGIEGFVQAGYNKSKNAGTTTYASGDRVLFRDNYYLNQQLTPQQLALFGTTQSVSFRRDLREWGPRYTYQDMDSIFVNGGITGPLFGDWKWNFGGSYGKTDFHAPSPNEILNERMAAAFDVVAGPNGGPVCRVTLVSNRFPDCKPLNLLGEGRADPAAIAWVMGDSVWNVVNKLYGGSANFSGTLFSTGAGNVSLAFGAEYRHQSIIQTSNLQAVNFTGIRGGTGNYFGAANVGASPPGSYNVKEVYVETAIPLISDASFTKSLELNGAFRYTNYSTSGGVKTYKAGVTWEPISNLILRGVYSRDMRAPGLTELFGAVTNQQRTVFDPVTQQNVNVDNPQGGNVNLVPERADTITAGVVVKPTFLPGFYASADYFDIKINDVIGTPGQLFQVFQECTANLNSPQCALIQRDPVTQRPLSVSGQLGNLAKVTTRGIDFEAGYGTKLGNGNLTFRLLGTRLISFKRQNSPQSALVEYAGTMDLPGFLSATLPLPKWRASLNVNYENDKFTFGVQERLIGGIDRSHGITYFVDNKVEPVWYTDVNLGWKFNTFGGDSEFFVSAQNVFNRKAPAFVPTGTFPDIPTSRAVYDVIGRYVTVGVRSKF